MYRYEKTSTEKATDKQKAFDYCVYMMLTGYYRTAICLNPVMETKLFLYYKDLSDNTAVSMEKEADRVIEKEILTKIPQDISQEDAEICILPWSNTYKCHGIRVKTPSGIATIHIQRNGKEKNASCIIQEADNEKNMKKVTENTLQIQ